MKVKDESRELTETEARRAFLIQVRDSVDYWTKRASGKREALDGLASTILSLIDTGSLDLPAFLLMPASTEDERLMQMERGQNWFPENCDIAGSLKEDYIKLRKS